MGKKKNKLINSIKWIGFIVKLIFYVMITILSFGFAFLLFAGSSLEEELFGDDDYLMKKWEESEKKK